MLRRSCISIATSTCLLFFFFFCGTLSSADHVELKRDDVSFNVRRLITKEKRRTLALTDSGEISAVAVDDGYRGPYHLQFFTLEPNSLFLPVMLQTDMVLYVHTGMYTASPCIKLQNLSRGLENSGFS